MKNIEAVIFDYDDTLVSSLKAKWAQHKYIAKTEYHKDLSDDEILSNWTKPYSELICTLYGDKDVGHAKAINMKYEKDFPKQLFPDTISVLQKLKSLHILTGIVTSTSAESLQKDIKRYELPIGLLDYIQTEDDTTFHKPDFRVFNPLREWLDERDILPQQIIYIGDGLHDMEAARSSDFHFAGVTTGLVTSAEFDKQGAISIDGLSDLFGLLK